MDGPRGMPDEVGAPIPGSVDGANESDHKQELGKIFDKNSTKLPSEAGETPDVKQQQAMARAVADLQAQNLT